MECLLHWRSCEASESANIEIGTRMDSQSQSQGATVTGLKDEFGKNETSRSQISNSERS